VPSSFLKALALIGHLDGDKDCYGIRRDAKGAAVFVSSGDLKGQMPGCATSSCVY